MNLKKHKSGEYGVMNSYRVDNAHSNGKSCNKRAFSLICADTEKGSLTLEAAMAVPLFIFFCIAILSFLVILLLQLDIQISMEETARSMGKKAYVLQQISQGNVSESEFSGDEATLISVGINPTTVKIWMLKDDELKNRLDSSRIIGKSSGLYTYDSSYGEADGILDIIVQYDYLVPWVPQYFGKLRLVQRMKSHVWIGKSLKENAGDGSADDSKTVYVTPTGTVYHTSKSCSYLDLSIHTSDSASVAYERNANGGKYERCSECASKGYSGTVYITDYGTNWHSSLSCSGLKRTVIETSSEDVQGMRACSKCGNGQ